MPCIPSGSTGEDPAASTASPWHQDDPHYNLDRPFITIWVTLDDVDADASLRVVPGSHATGVIYAPVEFAVSASTIGGPAIELAPDVDAEPERFDVRSWDLRAGDAVVLDSRTLHATGISAVADRPFRRISTRWAAPAHVAKFWAMLDHGLIDGDLLASSIFPLIRAR